MLRRFMSPGATTTSVARAGKLTYGLAAWLLGLPLPIIIIALLWGGCSN